METNICKLKFRRGIEADRKTITPEEGEPIFTTDTHRFCIGDGKTLGGVTFPKLYVGDDSNAVSGDLVYKDENLWLYTSDTDSVAVGGTQSIKVGDGVEIDNNKLTVKPASGISVDVSGVSVNVGYIKDSVGITEIDNRINTLSANAVVSPLAPLYNTSTIYAYTTANAKVPLAINDTGLTPVTSVNGVDVYSFKSSDLNIAKNVPDVTHVGINDGCVLNFDNTIKFDYSPTSYIQGYSTSVDENDITTYTLSTVKANVPVFSVAGTKPDIADGSITEAKLSQEVQNKLNAGLDIADGSITNVKLKDSTITGDKLADGAVTENKLSEDLKNKLLSDTFDYVIEQKHDIQTITPAFTWNDNHTIKNDLNGFSFKIERWSRKWKSGLIENWGYKKYNRTDQIDSVPGDVHNFGRGQIDLLEPHTSINYNIQLTCEWNTTDYSNGYTNVYTDSNNAYEEGGNKHLGWFLTSHIAPTLNYYTRGY